MTRSFHYFECENEKLAGTLDNADGATGLLIVSGGNELRSGAYAGMSKLAAEISSSGYPVFRYDRRGVGDSSGENDGFMTSEHDIAAAVEHFRTLCPQLRRLCAFGNCDAATALIFYGANAGIDSYILANPWVIQSVTDDKTEQTTTMPASAIRARYLDRLKNPRTILDLFSGKIDLSKLVSGLRHVAKNEAPGDLASKVAQNLQTIDSRVKILLSKRDMTARIFQAAWDSETFNEVRNKTNIDSHVLDSSSHSFGDTASKKWLIEKIVEGLNSS